MRSIRKWLAVGVVLGASLTGTVATACPNCKEAVEAQTGEGAKLKDGYYYSILFMMAMPFTLLGTGAFLVTRAIKRGGLPQL